ncbi:MAG TPA: helix-turn-helix domain-containing protein [Ktedonobacterales bacterium]|nr:helix-turn-helix domain-containing protein [Ktedonobacterales bacterium]
MLAHHTTTRGILNPKAVERKFRLSRPLPSPDVRHFVEHYWIVSWDLRGEEPYTQETLPYPCAHLVFEANNTRIYGVMTGKFARTLEQHGQVFGIKFRPAGFHQFLRRPMSQITNRILRFEEIFSERGDELETAMLSRSDERAMVALAEQFLRVCLPEADERAAMLNRIVERIAAQREITSVDELLASCDECAMSKRTLQRLFSEYIGVGPKWVIRRFRLHDAAGRIDEGDSVDWPRLAIELGYTDQTHFIKDFKAIVGRTPGEYGRKRQDAVRS